MSGSDVQPMSDAVFMGILYSFATVNWEHITEDAERHDAAYWETSRWLDVEARRRGYKNWIYAMYELQLAHAVARRALRLAQAATRGATKEMSDGVRRI